MSLRLFTRVARCKFVGSTLLVAGALFTMSAATLAADADQAANDSPLPSYQRSPNGDSNLPPQYQYQRSSNKTKTNAPPRPSPEPKVASSQTIDRKTAIRDSQMRTS